jgi:hypothetical protein
MGSRPGEAQVQLHGAWACHLLPGQSGLVRHSSTPWLDPLAALDQPATTDMALAPLRSWIKPHD